MERPPCRRVWSKRLKVAFFASFSSVLPMEEPNLNSDLARRVQEYRRFR